MLQIKKLAPKWYTPKLELEEDGDGNELPPAPDATQFQLGVLNHSDMAQVSEQAYLSEAGLGLVRPQGLVTACRRGVTDWRNVLGEDGQPLGFSHRALEDVPFNLLLELGGAVIAHNTLTDAEIKN